MTALTPPTPPKAKPYITIIAGRAPRQKAHMNRGHAINALKYMAREGTMWHEVDGEWRLVATAVVTTVKSSYGNWHNSRVEIQWEEGWQL